MHIDKFERPDGGYAGDDGCDYETAEDLLQCGLLGFCGCGDPVGNLLFVKSGLAHINKRQPHGMDFSRWYKARIAEGREIFGNEQSRYFFFYWCDKEGLTEHGGCVPGWLTNKGKELLEDLVEIDPTEDGGC